MAAAGKTAAAVFLQVKKTCPSINFSSVAQVSVMVYTVITGLKNEKCSRWTIASMWAAVWRSVCWQRFI